MERNLYIPSLDGLRGVAAIAVVVSHMGLLLGYDVPALLVGDESVALFFALSGFLMTHLYGDKPFTSATVIDYLVHRMARIYPVYFVAIAFVVLLSLIPGLDYIQPVDSAVQILRHVAMFGSTGVFWSIPPEIQFYLFFLLMWACFEAPRKRQALVVALTGIFALLLFFNFPGPGILLPSKLPYFVFGALAGLLYRSGRLPVSGAFAGMATLCFLVLFIIGRKIYPTDMPFWGASSALIATIIVYLTACEPPVLKTVLTARPLSFAGKISFSLYLFHMPVGFLVTLILPGSLNPVVAACVLFIASLMVAILAHYAVERPGRRIAISLWKNRRIAGRTETAGLRRTSTDLSA